MSCRVVSVLLVCQACRVKRVKRVVKSMGIDPNQTEVSKELTRLGKESAEDNFVVTYEILPPPSYDTFGAITI